MNILKKMMVILIIGVLCISEISGVSVDAVEEKDFSGIHATYTLNRFTLDIRAEGFSQYKVDDICGAGIVIEYNPDVVKLDSFIVEEWVVQIGRIADGCRSITYMMSNKQGYNPSDMYSNTFYFEIIGFGDPEIRIVETFGINKDGEKFTLPSEVNYKREVSSVIQPDVQYDEATDTLTVTGDGYVYPYILPEQLLGAYAETAKQVILKGELIAEHTIFDNYTMLEKVVVGDDVEIGRRTFPKLGEKLTIVGKPMSSAELTATKRGYTFVPSTDALRGDLDLNGYLNAEDALGILEMASNNWNDNARYGYTADVNADGLINAADALEVLMAAAGIQ